MARSLAQFTADLRRLPRVVAHRVAEEAAPAITDAAKETFKRSETPYGADWKPGAEGQRVTLVKTGALSKFVKYVATGAKLRIALGVKYAKYQIGRRPVYPRQDGALPDTYVRALQRAAVKVCREEMGR